MFEYLAYIIRALKLDGVGRCRVVGQRTKWQSKSRVHSHVAVYERHSNPNECLVLYRLTLL